MGKKELAAELIVLDNTQERISETLDILWSQTFASNSSRIWDAAKTSRIGLAEIKEHFFDLDDMLNTCRDIYCETFTEEELQGLVDLYSSPLGRTITEKTPLVIQQVLLAAQEYVEEKFSELENKQETD